MQEDISNASLVVMAVMALVISVLGTLMVVDSVNEAKLRTPFWQPSEQPSEQGDSPTSGTLSFSIAPDREPKQHTGIGTVALTIKPTTKPGE